MTGETEKEVLNRQNPHWERTYHEHPEMFGEEPSEPAIKAMKLFRREGKNKILELGAGQGRDTLFFARNGFQVYALDYSETGVETIREKAQAQRLAQTVTAARHDVRRLRTIRLTPVTPTCSSAWPSQPPSLSSSLKR